LEVSKILVLHISLLSG